MIILSICCDIKAANWSMSKHAQTQGKKKMQMVPRKRNDKQNIIFGGLKAFQSLMATVILAASTMKESEKQRLVRNA